MAQVKTILVGVSLLGGAWLLSGLVRKARGVPAPGVSLALLDEDEPFAMEALAKGVGEALGLTIKVTNNAAIPIKYRDLSLGLYYLPAGDTQEQLWSLVSFPTRQLVGGATEVLSLPLIPANAPGAQAGLYQVRGSIKWWDASKPESAAASGQVASDAATIFSLVSPSLSLGLFDLAGR